MAKIPSTKQRRAIHRKIKWLNFVWINRMGVKNDVNCMVVIQENGICISRDEKYQKMRTYPILSKSNFFNYLCFTIQKLKEENWF